MITINLTKKSYWENDVDAYVFLVTEQFESAADISKIEKDFYPHVKMTLRKHQFKGKVGQSFALSAMKNNSLVQFLFVGLGKQDDVWHRELECLRRAIGLMVSRLKGLEIQNAVLQIPDSKIFGVDSAELIKQIAIIAHMADYEFIKFKSERKEAEWTGQLLLVGSDSKESHAALAQGIVIGHATNQARHYADMPPNIANPSFMSEQAKQIAHEHKNLDCLVFGRDKAQELGMGGFLSVDSGSDQDGKFVVLEYMGAEKNAPTIALIGKGITFDSGGISLKPSTSMSGMKFDMTGAAAVMSAMQVIAQLKPNVHVVGLTPLVENMPSGKSNRQDDIITMMNGKTVEILSTDAEGRLILADAICYAEKFYKPDLIIDIATLTGACLYALGHFYTGLMSRNEKLLTRLKEAGQLTGDRVWELPLDPDFKEAIKSDVADMANCGAPNYKAGTITAGWFLHNFVTKAALAHLDIAGTADGVPGINYMGKGASGVGVRLLVDFVMKYKN